MISFFLLSFFHLHLGLSPSTIGNSYYIIKKLLHSAPLCSSPLCWIRALCMWKFTHACVGKSNLGRAPMSFSNICAQSIQRQTVRKNIVRKCTRCILLASLYVKEVMFPTLLGVNNTRHTWFEYVFRLVMIFGSGFWSQFDYNNGDFCIEKLATYFSCMKTKFNGL